MPVFDSAAWGTNSNDPTAPAPTVKPKSSFGDTLGATWNQESVWVPSLVKPSLEYTDDTSFDFKSYDKSLWPLVSVARNKEHAEDLIKQAEKERANKEIRDNASWVTGLSTDVIVGLTNPLNFLGFGPSKTLLQGVGKAVAANVIGTAATEPILQSNQVTRTWEDSALNIATAGAIAVPFGAVAHFLGNKLSHGTFADKASAPKTVFEPNMLMDSGGHVSGGAAAVKNRVMTDAKLESIPFLPKSWTEPITKFSLLGKFSRSANQELTTSSFVSVRNAQNILLRSGMSTVENAQGVANQVPIEVAVGQRAGDLYTRLIETDKNLRDAWWSKVENGTYDSQNILNTLRIMDPTLPENYKVNRTSFDKVMKAYMADDSTLGSQMDEVVKRVKAGADIREQLDADKIDFGLADKGKLVDIASGKTLEDPTKGVDAAMLSELKKQRVEIAAELENLKANRSTKGKLTDAEVAERKAIKDRLDGHDKAIEAKAAELEQKKADWDGITPDSKLHKFAYEDGSHYLSRVFDKGRINGNPNGFMDALVEGWKARNPDIEFDADGVYSLREAAEMVLHKLLNEHQTTSLGEVMKNLDMPGHYIKDRTLAIDDKFLLNWTHDDVLSSEMYHISQAVVDVELARANVKFDDLIHDIQTEYRADVDAINLKFKDKPEKAAEAIGKLGKERDKNIEELTYAMQRLKRQSGVDTGSTMNSFERWWGRVNKIAGMAQLGSSAIPNSLGDVASVARSFGTGRMYKIVAKAFDKDFRADIQANAKQMGVLSELVDRAVRDAHMGEVTADSMNPNKGFKGAVEQKFDRGLGKAVDVFGKVSLIDGWSKVGRTIASAASTQNILDSAAKGWDNISPQTRTELAKFYIDKNMLERISAQASKHSTDVEGIKFAGIDKWDDAEAVRVFRASVYAHTEHALNIPSIGTSSRFMSETFMGRMLMRYKTFNNAAHESTFLSSMQNREYSRIATATLNYAFWGFASVYAYDTISGRDNSMENYFGNTDKAILTGWKILAKGGFVAAGSDAFVTLVKLAGHKNSPLHDAVREVFPESLEKELYPKYDDVGLLAKIAGPTYGYLEKAGTAAVGLMDGDASDKDIGNVRGLIPGQNIGWLRRGIDYLEEALGGRQADRLANQ